MSDNHERTRDLMFALLQDIQEASIRQTEMLKNIQADLTALTANSEIRHRDVDDIKKTVDEIYRIIV